MGRLSNIPLRRFRDFLDYKGLKCIRTVGGHEKWVRADLRRPVMLQTHIDPVPEFIIRNNLKTIGATIKEFTDYLGN
ncbi:type II toxin-antitoxin system HicA family toxin [uncultured Alistipes sp.]|uniref:type II toxin-antitoxin system HicA family toxin n=1 Tax=uncultured Alistipes sp. TaxID=538949 RepID=UPI00258B24CE|nr:type II toxin-antitoxin system HicA family toxin [uncultured Alistipes sp.]